MRCPSLRSSSLVLGLGLALACSSAGRESEPDSAIESGPAVTTPVASTPAPSPTDEPHAPTVGEPAPALALDSLSGTRVQLPAAESKRAAVLIFGSFS
jgi:hypothetical protein